MKTILLMIVGMMLVFPVLISEGFSQCVYNDDWPPAPCFDMGKISKLEYKCAWAPYYVEKGDELMKSKHSEMHDALRNGSIEEWVDASMQNWNVYNYYRSVGDIESQFPYDVELLESSPQYHLERAILVILSVIVVALSVVCVIMWKKRK